MATEILAVPEDHLEDMIRVIRAGIGEIGDDMSVELLYILTEWCREEEEYLNGA